MSTHHVSFDTVPEEARSFHGQPAGLVTRTVANVVDLIVVAALLAAGYSPSPACCFCAAAPDSRSRSSASRSGTPSGFGAWIVYMAVGWATNGRTYGD